jgi:hypothetical protein
MRAAQAAWPFVDAFGGLPIHETITRTDSPLKATT